MRALLLPLLWHCARVDAFAATPRPLGAPRRVRAFACDRRHAATVRRRRSSRLHMGKGDGKKKRKKKSAAPAPAAPAAAAAAPRRVSTDINVPVKRQIMWAKLNKEYTKSGTAFRQTKNSKKTSYRKRLGEEEQQEVLVDRKRRNGEVDWDVILSRNGTSTGALVLVDGYNVIYQWPRLKKHMLKGNTQRARELLVRDLEEVHCIKGWRIECVFDGFGRSTGQFSQRGERVGVRDRELTKQDMGRGVRVVYSGVGASADSYIEARCLDAKRLTRGQLSVSSGSLIAVSNDGMIRMVATGAGALCMSSDRLVDELRAVRKITEYRVEHALALANGGSVRPAGPGRHNIRMPAMQGAKGTGAGAVGVSDVDGKQVVTTFRGGQFVIEDKRKKKPKPRDAEGRKKAVFEDMVQGTGAVPSWALLPEDRQCEEGR